MRPDGDLIIASDGRRALGRRTPAADAISNDS